MGLEYSELTVSYQHNYPFNSLPFSICQKDRATKHTGDLETAKHQVSAESTTIPSSQALLQRHPQIRHAWADPSWLWPLP